MSLGLLGGYGSDPDSPSDPESPGGEEGGVSGDNGSLVANKQSKDPLEESEVVTETGSVKRTSSDTDVTVGREEPFTTSYGLSGEGEYLESASSNSDLSEGDDDGGDREIVRERSSLPLPELDGSSRLASSVFSNPYREAEEEKLSVLRQHVDLSPNVDPNKERQRKNSRGLGRGRRNRHPQVRSDAGEMASDEFWTEGDSPANTTRRGPQKHRSGVSESLMPPKKFMKIHNKIRAQEQPWTAQ